MLRLDTLGKLFILGAHLSILYFDVLESLLSRWTSDENYQHCFLIPFISLYLIKLNKEEEKTRDPYWLQLSLLLFSYALYFVTLLFPSLVISSLSLLFAILSLLSILDFLCLHKNVGPLMYLLLMIPMPTVLEKGITFPLQQIICLTVEFCFQYVDIPIYRVGNTIYLPNCNLEVVESCSGIKQIMAFFAIGFFFAIVSKSNWVRKLTIIASTVPVAMITNIFRILFMSVISYFASPEYIKGSLHDIEGLFCVGLGLVLFFGIYKVITK